MMPTQIKVHLLFTFHNVSINSDFCDRTRPRGLYLHSTMFLLILLVLSFVLYFHLNLHSTMFLLIHVLSMFCLLFFSIFTFHNVSINSVTATPVSVILTYLHSTMFLLIHLELKEYRKIMIIYIPQCFY